MSLKSKLKQIYAFKKTLLFVLPIILLSPLIAVYPGTVSSCGYTIALMAIYWVFEVLPLPVTAFIPLIIFPMSGIMSADEVSSAYFKDTTFLFVGGLMIAISVELTGLHKRIALNVLLIVGSKPHSLMFGFMLTTSFLSMWISNTATTAMMLPIVEAVFNELKASESTEENEVLEMKEIMTENENKELESDDEDSNSERLDNMIKGITISIPYSSSIGGTITLTGTGPNLVLAGQFKTLFPGADAEISFGNWIAYNAPGGILMLILAYIWLSTFYLGLRLKDVKSLLKCGAKKTNAEKRVQNVIKREYDALGSIKWGEVTVAIVFIATVLLWFFRKPGFMPGYAQLFPQEEFLDDGTIAMTMAFLLFVLPGQRPSFLCRTQESNLDSSSEPIIYKPVPAILSWKKIQRRFAWDIVFLLAGGFALADGSAKSGFSDWMGSQLSFLNGLESWVICLIVTIIVCVFTECSSNVATASLFIPILADLAQKIEVNPLYLMIPPILASSLAFMLPVATPPNAIAFSYGHLKVLDLVKAGWLMNLLGVLVISVFINTYGMSFWGLNNFPDWANPNITTTSSP